MGVVCTSKWVGDAWQEISNSKDVIIRNFQKCGISVAVDGTKDDKFNTKGIPHYEMPTADAVSGALEFQIDSDEDEDGDDND